MLRASQEHQFELKTVLIQPHSDPCEDFQICAPHFPWSMAVPQFPHS